MLLASVFGKSKGVLPPCRAAPTLLTHSLASMPPALPAPQPDLAQSGAINLDLLNVVFGAFG